MRFGGRRWAIGMSSALVVVIGLGAWITWDRQPEEPKFCKASLAIVDVNGTTVVPQDQNDPGRDRCDFDETSPGDRVLGYDCKVREPDGEVTVELVPNRGDGTCGMPGPGETWPDPWPEAG